MTWYAAGDLDARPPSPNQKKPLDMRLFFGFWLLPGCCIASIQTDTLPACYPVSVRTPGAADVPCFAQRPSSGCDEQDWLVRSGRCVQSQGQFAWPCHSITGLPVGPPLAAVREAHSIVPGRMLTIHRQECRSSQSKKTMSETDNSPSH